MLVGPGAEPYDVALGAQARQRPGCTRSVAEAREIGGAERVRDRNEKLVVVATVLAEIEQTPGRNLTAGAACEHIRHQRQVVLRRFTDFRGPEYERVVEQGARAFLIGVELAQEVSQLLGVPGLDGVVRFEVRAARREVVRNHVVIAALA